MLNFHVPYTLNVTANAVYGKLRLQSLVLSIMVCTHNVFIFDKNGQSVQLFQDLLTVK